MENPRCIYGIRLAELPLLDRGSSATKTGLAVLNPRISERSDVATIGSAPAYALENTSQDNLLQKVAGSIFFLLTCDNHIRCYDVVLPITNSCIYAAINM